MVKESSGSWLGEGKELQAEGSMKQVLVFREL